LNTQEAVMWKSVWVFCCLVLVLVTGCGGGAGKRAANDPSSSGYAPGGGGETVAVQQKSSEGGPFGGSAESAPPAPSAAAQPRTDSTARSESRTPSAEPPRERPGLGTEWGETRTSRVHDVTFVRADQDRPFAVAQLFYNDRRGVEEQAKFAARNVERRRDFSAGGGAISVAIQGGSGDPLEAVRIGDRTLVVGQAGDRYTIVLTNHTGHRFEAVATVDGLDVINGKAGGMQNRGYVLMPFATLEIDGFRQSHNAVAAFRFGAVGESYAAQMGNARNVGVIGVAFFSERGDNFANPWNENELNRRDTANPFPSSDPRFARPAK
jgi:hypothetical protein